MNQSVKKLEQIIAEKDVVIENLVRDLNRANDMATDRITERDEWMRLAERWRNRSREMKR